MDKDLSGKAAKYKIAVLEQLVAVASAPCLGRSKATNAERKYVHFCPHVSVATRAALAIIFFVFLMFPALAEARMYCFQKITEPGGTGGGKVRVAGFTIEVKPVPGSDGNGECHANVTSPEGEIIYSFDDWGAEIDPVTGKDVNGDGEPDAVLVGFSGGAHCCWTYHIISLGKKPGLIREFENQSSASFKDLKGNGQIEIVIWDGSFDEALGMNHAFSVFPTLIVQLRGTEFHDVGSEFWRVFEKEIQKERAGFKEQQLREFALLDPNELYDDEYLKTKYGILLITLDYLYGGRHEEAARFFTRWWPKESREETWNEMLIGYCSGLRADLKVEQHLPCADNRPQKPI